MCVKVKLMVKEEGNPNLRAPRNDNAYREYPSGKDLFSILPI